VLFLVAQVSLVSTSPFSGVAEAGLPENDSSLFSPVSQAAASFLAILGSWNVNSVFCVLLQSLCPVRSE